MGDMWKNPSRSAVIYDRRNNRHIQPGEVTSLAPDHRLVSTGRLMEIREGDVQTHVAHQPERLVSSLEIVDEPSAPPALELVEDDSSEAGSFGRRRRRS